jgi:hypothetical protein
MVKASRISFNEPKRLPSLDYHIDEFDLVFDVKHLCLKKKLKNSSLLSQELTHSCAAANKLTSVGEVRQRGKWN